MEKNIFTDEQFNYYLSNVEEAKKLNKLSNDLLSLNRNDEISLKSDAAHNSFNEMISFFKGNSEKINLNLKPFESRNNEYEMRRNSIINEHGYSITDMYDEDTLKDIILLQREMKSEAESMSHDLRNVIVNERTNELNKMMSGINNKNQESLATRFK